MRELPNGGFLKIVLKKIEALAAPQGLQIDRKVLKESLKETIYLRDRDTGLTLINQ